MTDNSEATVLVAGATGVVGAAGLEAFLHAGYQVLAISRRPPLIRHPRLTHLALDLTDAAGCRAAAGAFAPVTHLAYAALFEKPGLIQGWLERDQMETNQRMLCNLLDPLLDQAPDFRQLTLLQGTKAYGAHVHAIDLPAREDAVRDAHENFYWLQEDEVRRRSADADFSFTILRPQIVYGYAYGSAMNLITALGAYAAICRETGEPFGFPGGATPLQEAVDADLLGRVMVWAAGAAAARNEIFNVTNGDVYHWPSLWPFISTQLGFGVTDPTPRPLSQWLPERAPVWQRIARSGDLRTADLDALLGESHFYADALLGYGQTRPPPAALVSTIKLRQAGFGECVDTRNMFVRLFREAALRKVLPELLVQPG